VRKWCESKKLGGFCFTSNIDGHWEKSGFAKDQIYEVHGSVLFMQCCVGRKKCRDKIWKTGELKLHIGEDDKAKKPFPQCPYCNGIARPK